MNRIISMISKAVRGAATIGMAAAASATVAEAQVAPAPPPPPAATWTFGVQNTTRVEAWRFFLPHPGGGDPDYTFGANRLLLRASLTSRRIDVAIAGQFVSMVGLPGNASGPGALGTGALYFAQNDSKRHPQNLYLKLANLRFKQLAPGLDIVVGRQGYGSAGEVSSADAQVEAIKRQRLNSRLVGEFEWSIYQRAFDGVRVDWRNRRLQLTGVAFMPTQGGFTGDANRTMTRLRVAGATMTMPPANFREHREHQAFAWYYDDERRVTGRPDNTGLSAVAADVAIATVGGSTVASLPIGPGRIDYLAWGAVQTGDWYGQDHRGLALAFEAGYRWDGLPWMPWIRAGWFHASGDSDAGDAKHGTFFPMLPTVRRFVQTTTYSTMNLGDVFVQFQVKPSDAATLRLDVHRLTLASAADRWYAGSGATLSTGSNFGYVSRASHGSRDLGTSIELTASYDVSRRWNLNAFLGTMRGGRVVTGSFAGNQLWFLYFENVIRLDFPWR